MTSGGDTRSWWSPVSAGDIEEAPLAGRFSSRTVNCGGLCADSEPWVRCEPWAVEGPVPVSEPWVRDSPVRLVGGGDEVVGGDLDPPAAIARRLFEDDARVLTQFCVIASLDPDSFKDAHTYPIDEVGS